MATIADLGRKVKEKYPGEYDDIPDQELGLRVRAKYPEYSDFTDDTTAAAPDTTRSGETVKDAEFQKGPTLGQRIIRGKALPIGGGIAGAMAGATLSPQTAALGAPLGPAGIAIGAAIPPVVGAFVGGAGLEGYRQSIAGLMGEKSPETSLEAIKGLGGAGVEQALNEVTGRLFLGTAKKVARPFMEAAIKATPQIAQVAIREGIGASARGMVKLNKLWEKVTNAERTLARNATKAAVRLPGYTIADAAYKEVRRIMSEAPQSEINKLIRLHNEFVQQYGSNIRPTTALRIRKYHDGQATNLYALRDQGKGLAARTKASIEELWHKAIGQQTREVLQSRVPEIADPVYYRALTGNGTLPSEIVPLKSLMDQTMARTPSFGRKLAERSAASAAGATAGFALSPDNRMQGAGLGAAAGLAAGSAARSAVSPRTLSNVALAPGNPLLAQLLLNLPRLYSVAQSDDTATKGPQ